MAKATICIEDTEDHGIKIRVEFDPPVPAGVNRVTGVQALAYDIAKLITGHEGTPEDDDNG